MNEAFHIIVRGIVQGVAFRYYTKTTADGLNLHGWVRNLEDGTVEIEISGDSDSIDEFLAWCHKGAPASTVEELVYRKIDYFSSSNFEIIR